MEDRELLRLAAQARANAYAPYSRFRVGAALLCEDGAVFTGCNVENAAFSPGICAERAALAGAVSAGVRRFVTLAVVGGAEESGGARCCPPCGVCRQTLREFGAALTVVLAPLDDLDAVERFTLEELLPRSFGPEDLGREGDAP